MIFTSITNDEVDIPTLQELETANGDTFLKVDTKEDMLALILACGWESEEEFNSDVEVPLDEIVGRFFLIPGRDETYDGQWLKQAIEFHDPVSVDQPVLAEAVAA